MPTMPSGLRMSDEQTLLRQLRVQLATADCGLGLPMADILSVFQANGKAFVPTAILDALVAVREQLNSSPTGPSRLFLDTLVDKATETYDYRTYIGTEVLAQAIGTAGADFPGHLAGRIRLMAGLLADLVRFETRTLLGLEQRFAQDLGSDAGRKRRIMHALSAIVSYEDLIEPQPGSASLLTMIGAWTEAAGQDGPIGRDLGATTLAMVERLLERLSERERQAIQLAMLPVSTSHDEYVFIRVLQAFELIFGAIVEGFRQAVSAVDAQGFWQATAVMTTLSALLALSPALFRVLTTMPAEHFAAFRVHTDGASAIQSENYKLIETLAGHPTRPRFQSAAFTSVPRVAVLYTAGQLRNLEDALRPLLADPVLSSDLAALRAAMQTFDKRFCDWKNVHVKIAIRMLGDAAGTGATSGTPYLRAYAAASLFPYLYDKE